ncbi:protein BRAWNIN-like [Dipodomys spectabilis]|uniref:protein BRAWNIN-like n=1 Tax=Dipodomys spectabilis TaxID=105255 RepID=UPI001C537043|nr:protein BRAWNIN-like [Dipodomys spectabilis]
MPGKVGGIIDCPEFKFASISDKGNRLTEFPRVLKPGMVQGVSPPTIPAGVSWPSYLEMLAAMCTGAQVVHRYYRPDLTIPEIPPKPGELKTELWGLKERQHKPQVAEQ